MTTRSSYPAKSVPPRALALSVASLAVPVVAALAFPGSLGELGVMLWLLALVPAFLLAYYRGWWGVTLACGVGMAVLALTQSVAGILGRQIQEGPLFFAVVVIYIGIALGIGWLTDRLSVATGRKQIEEIRLRLVKALETMQLGVTITDTNRKIIFSNPAEARNHGYTVGELVGKNVGIFAPSGKLKPLEKEELKALSSWKRESINVRKDGSTFPVQLTSDVVLSASGDPIGIVTTCEDITERKERQKQLERATRELRKSHGDLQATQMRLIEAEKLESVGRLAAGVAHEVKNPLMVILTGVKILTQHLQDGSGDIRVLLDDMTDAVARADAVICGLLDFARPHDFELVPEDLNTIVEQSLSLVKHEMDKSHVTLAKELAPDLPKVNLNAFKIQQVLINLFTNAVHAMPEGGELTVRSYSRPVRQLASNPNSVERENLLTSESDVILEVDDTGTGIPEDKLAKIFDPFFTTKPTGKGTGLGLSVSWQIVEMHGASIEFKNRDEGGVTVTIIFRSDAGE
ncbi:MAG: PAS domain S-box protein [Gemmatimonadetes bacterium]|nr:PAS domain S-box protein [Gemmatimonadota bacterium]